MPVAQRDVVAKQSRTAAASEEHVAHYRLIREIGRGGQAVVWLAEDEALHRKVALKLIKGLGPEAPRVVQRFRREAEITSKLDLPGICPVYEVGFDEVPWIAMRLVSGDTLAARIAAGRTAKAENPTSCDFISLGETSADEGEPIDATPDTAASRPVRPRASSWPRRVSSKLRRARCTPPTKPA